MFYYNKYRAYIIRRIFSLYLKAFKIGRVDLQEFLGYCSGNIAYYLGKGRELEKYPYIGKKTVAENFLSFANPACKIRNTGYTSGTTGTPGKYFRDIRSMAAEQYFQGRYFGWKGKNMVILRGERLFDADYAGNVIYKAVPFIKELYVSTFHLSDRTIGVLVEKLARIRNKCLWAYPSAAYLLAEYCLRNDVRLEFDIVATSSESLYDYQIEAIEKAFGRKIKDWYGQAERVAALYRCEMGKYHEVENYSHVEYIPAYDSLYEIAGTTLHNKVMPLVRYKMNDLIELSDEKCGCGNPGPVITRIHGRKSNYVVLPDATLSETSMALMFKFVSNVTEAQVIQHADRTFTVRVVRDKAFGAEDENVLLKSIYGILPENLCRVVYVNAIERDSRGKFRFLINEGTAG